MISISTGTKSCTLIFHNVPHNSSENSNHRKWPSYRSPLKLCVSLLGSPCHAQTQIISAAAKAVAGEAGVPFFAASASEFVELFVGKTNDCFYFQAAKHNLFSKLSFGPYPSW